MKLLLYQNLMVLMKSFQYGYVLFIIDLIFLSVIEVNFR